MKSFPPHNRPVVGSTSPGRTIRRVRLVLLNTAERELGFIIRTLMELTRYANAEATHRMWEAYHFGRSPILVTHFERAELYLEQYQERGLALTMEPA